VITYIDYVSDNSGDWTGIYVNFHIKYQGHSIPDFIWIELLNQISGTQVESREWTTAMDHETYTSYPIEFMDLTMFNTQYELEGINGADTCALHEADDDRKS
jgi:hypothetical protein